jgi:uncharacterized protein (TIGR02246 family)
MHIPTPQRPESGATERVSRSPNSWRWNTVREANPARKGLVSASLLVAIAATGVLVSACDGSGGHGPTAVHAELASAPPQPVMSAGVPTAMARAIDELLASWATTWNEGDGIAFGGYYSPGADFVNPLGMVFTGRDAITAVHLSLFHPATGPFRGSSMSYVVRRIAPITGTVALVDATVTVTGFAGTPPGLVQWAPGVLKTRHHSVVARNGGDWEIVAQQITAMQPGVAD